MLGRRALPAQTLAIPRAWYGPSSHGPSVNEDERHAMRLKQLETKETIDEKENTYDVRMQGSGRRCNVPSSAVISDGRHR